MKLLPLCLASVLCFLPIGTRAADAQPALPSTTASSPPDDAAAAVAVAVPEATPKALNYYRSGMIWWGVRLAWGLIVPTVILFSGFSAWLRRLAGRMGRKWFFVIVLYAFAFCGVSWIADLPFDYLEGFVREHAYGVSNQTFGKWLGDSGKGMLVAGITTALVLWVPYLLLRKAPRRWWLITGVAAVPFIVLTLLVQPIWIDPLFNEFGPMKDKPLEADLLALAERAGIAGSRVFEVNKSVDTKAVNAYVTGFLETKRIVLWDTLLTKLDHDEVLFVMGHEMGHYVLGHVWKLILLLSTVVLVTLYAIHRGAQAVIARFSDRFGFTELADVASLPLLLLFFQLSIFVLLPPINAITRHYEQEADRFGLELRRQNRAAATAFVKLQQANLGNPWPGWIYTAWRASHPPLGSRIEFCNTYRPWETGQPLRYADRFRAAKP